MTRLPWPKTLPALNSRWWSLFFPVIVIFLLIIFRIWIITGIPKLYIYGPHDDLYFARSASEMLNGRWLGKYNSLTLIKAPFYTIFLAFSASTGLPLFLNETIFYIIACLIMYAAVQPFIKRGWLRLLFFALLLYCPAGLVTDWTLRVYREFVYFSLTLLVIAFSIGLFLRLNRGRKAMIVWAAGLGISLGAFFITREEGAWIIPALAFLYLSFFWVIWKKDLTYKWKRTAILLIPLIVSYLPIFAISYLNYSHYGFWGISDQLDPNFIRVISALGRIRTNSTWYPYVRVYRDALDKAYAATPMMAALKDPLDRQMDAWEPVSEQSFNAKPVWYKQKFSNHGTEIGAGHFPWVLRGAVKDLGYFSNGRYPADYFYRLANELESACGTGRLDCLPALNIPFIGSIDQRQFPVIQQMFLYDARLFLKLSLIKIPSLDFSRWPQFTDDIPEFAVFDRLAHNPVIDISGKNAPVNDGLTGPTSHAAKSEIIHVIYSLYHLFTPALTALSLLCFALLAASQIFTESDRRLEYLLLLIFLAGLFISRFAMLAIVETTTTASGASYVTSNYLFLYEFAALSIYGGLSQFPTKVHPWRT